VLFVFVDGVGVGPADASRNPLAAAPLPVLQRLLGGARPVLEELGEEGAGAARSHMVAIDATLGVAGRPQSGTGQSALLSGTNTAALLGRHFGPWVPTALREQLARESLFARALAAGHGVAFANAYPAGYMAPGGRGFRRPGAFPLAAHAAGLLTRDESHVHREEALVSSITTDSWRRYVDPAAPAVSPAAAGRALARIAARHHLTVFAHYDTDYVGHRGDPDAAARALQLVDDFLGGVLEELPPDVLLVLTSDHGNLEDTTTGHTTNPVPLLVVGSGARRYLTGARRVTDVASLILGMLGTRAEETAGSVTT